MKLVYLATCAVLASTSLAGADAHLGSGDPAAGEKAFAKCKTCHAITSEDGTQIVKGGRTGPNLYGVVGQPAGMQDFRYGKSLEAAAEAGLVWDSESFAKWVADPRGFLVEFLDDSKARSKMSFKLKDGAEDIYAYLATVGPAPTN